MELKNLPFVSVVLPIRNESRFIHRGLEAILGQDYPLDRLEVLVVDGLSTDGTRAIVESIQASHPIVRLIDNPKRIVSTGLNVAIPVARGDIIVRVDGHCEIGPDYVRRCVEHLQNGGVDGVGGPVSTIGETYLARVIAAAMSTPFGVGNSAFRTTQGMTRLTDTVPFPAYTRTILEKAGPYDEELVRNQDDEYNYRLRKLGARILLAADLRSQYYSRTSLRSLWRQYFQYGYFKVRVLQKHAFQMKSRQFAPPVFVTALMICLIAAPFWSLARLGLAAIVGLYLMTTFGASLLTSAKKGWYLFPLLPITFAILHMSYGLGFLLGLFKFWNRWRQGCKPAVFSAVNAQGAASVEHC